MNFAADLGKRLRTALESEPASRQLFGELEECVLQDQRKSNTSVQALCLDNARRLSVKYPSLSESFDKLKGNAPESIVRLSKLVE